MLFSIQLTCNCDAGKVTKHEVPGGDELRDLHLHHRTALDFSVRRSIPLHPSATRRCTSNCLIMIRPIVPSIVAYGHVHQEQSFCAKLS